MDIELRVIHDLNFFSLQPSPEWSATYTVYNFAKAEIVGSAERSRSRAKWSNNAKQRMGRRRRIHGADDLDFFGAQPTTTTPSDTTSPSAPRIKRRETPVYVFLEDRISEFKQKIAAVTGIPIYQQHLFLLNIVDDTIIESLPLYYNISTDTEVDVHISHINNFERILGLPVDIEIARSTDTLVVEESEYSSFMRDIQESLGERIYYVIDMDLFTAPIRAELLAMQRADQYQFDMIYFGFVLKYWPMMSQEMFIDYLNGESITDKFPDFVPRLNFDKEADIFARTYAVTENPPIVIKSATITNSKRNYHAPLDVVKLFDTFATNIDVPLVRLRTLVNYESVTVTKIYRQSTEDMQMLYDRVKNSINVTSNNCVLFVIGDVVIQINAAGKYNIRFNWGENSTISFKEIYKLAASVNPFIEALNSRGREIFTTNARLPLVKVSTTELTDIDLYLSWPSSVSNEDFNKLGSILHSETPLHVTAATGQARTDYRATIIKGTTNDIKDLGTWNEFSYYTDLKVKQRFNSTRGMGREFVISRRTADIRAELFGVREEEMQFLLNYVTGLIESWKSGTTPAPLVDLKAISKTNILKLLKTRDPELYVFKNFGSDIVYSRLCQKDHQPIAYTALEYNSLDAGTKKKAVKYWNFTSKEDMYYVCPNPDFPHLSFITGQHPQGYCLPCCKKTELGDGDGSRRKESMYAKCLEHHSYEQNDVGTDSRYVMNYGKVVNPGRIGKLPEVMEKFIQYNVNDQEMIDKIKVTYNDRVMHLTYLRKLAKKAVADEVSIDDLKSAFPELISGAAEASETAETTGEAVKKRASERSETAETTAHENTDTDVPLIVSRSGDIIDGLDRLRDAMRAGAKKYPVVIFGETQLGKAERKFAKLEMNEYNIPGYYVLGVPQNNETMSNIGALYAVAEIFGKSIEQYVGMVADLAKTRDDLFYSLIDGELPNYFENVVDFISALRGLVTGKLGITNFSSWNELFIESAYYFGIVVLLIDDLSIDYSGMSVRSASEDDHIEIELPARIDKKMLAGSGIAAILRKNKKITTLFGSGKAYYPIVVATPQIFFKHTKYDKIRFDAKDILMSLLVDLIETRDDLGMNMNSIVSYATRAGLPIGAGILNKRGLVYAIMIDDVPIPIDYSVPNISKTVPGPTPIVTDIDKLLRIMAKINEVLEHEAKQLGRKTADGSGYIPLIPYLKISAVVERADGRGSADVCGLIMNGFYIKSTAAKLPKSLADLPRHTMQHSPELLDSYMNMWELPEIDEKAIAKVHEYDNYVSKTMSIIDSERNAPIRKELYAILDEINWRKISSVSEGVEKIEKVLAKWPADVVKILEIAGKLTSDIREIVENLVFEFDQKTMSALRASKKVEDTISILEKVNKASARLIEIFAEDLHNPLKREQLLAANLMNMIDARFHFNKSKTEELFIKYK